MSNTVGRTILLVEDEALIAAVEQLILEKFGYNVLTAETGEIAVSIVNSKPGIDLILMDINLGSGIAGTKAAELILENHDLPLIFLSSHTEREIVEKTEGITSYGYIVKDSGETVLIASIKMAFRLFDALTKEREKEEALRESEKNYRDIFDNALEGIFRISTDGEIIHANRSFALMLGYESPEDLSICIKNRTSELWIDSQELSSFNTRLTENNSILNYETKYRCKDGDSIWVSLSSKTIRNTGGEILYYDGFIQNITEKKLSADLIHKSEQRYRHLANNIPDIIYTLDNFGKLVTVNNPALERYGYKVDDIRNMEFLDFIHPDDRDRVISSVIKTHELKREHTTGLQFRINTKDEFVHWFELNANTHFDQQGNFIGENGVLRDITDRKRAEEALIKHNNSLRSINEYLLELAYVQYNEIFSFIIKKLKSIFNVKIAWIGEFNSELMEMDIKAWTLNEDESLQMIETAKKNREELVIHLNEENLQLIMMNPTIVTRSLFEISFGAIPIDVAKSIEEVLGIEWIMAVALIDKNELIATALVMGDPSYEIPDREELLAFCSISANAIKRKRAEEAMLTSSEQYNLLANNIPDIIYSLNDEGKIIAVNNSAFERYGYKESDVIDKLFIDFIYSEDRDSIIKHTLESIAKKETYTSGLQFRMKAANGEPYWFEANAKSYYNNEGVFIGETGVLRDITDQKNIKDASIKHTVFIQSVNNYLLEMAYIDYHDIFRYVVKKMNEIFNVTGVWINEYDPSSSLLKLKAWTSSEEQMSEIFKLTGKNGDNLKIYITNDNHNRIVSDKISIFNSIFDLMYRVVPEETCCSIDKTLKADWLIPVALIDRGELVASAMLFGNNESEIPNFEELLTFGSITASMIKRKRAEHTMKKNEEFFKLISGVVADYVYSVRIQPDGSLIRNFNLGNISDLLGYQPEVNSSVDVWTNLIVPEDIPVFYEKIKDGFHGLKGKFEVRILAKNEVIKYLLGYIIPVNDEKDKKVNLVFAAFQDITDRKNSEEKIKNLLVEKELVLREVHHRIKNNMETIKNLLYLQADVLNNQKAAIALHDAGNRVQSMMLLYDKLYRSDNFGVISFSNYCSTLVEETVANFPNRDQVKIMNQIDDFVLDPKKIQPLGMIINELITNIMKHAFKGPEIGIINVFGVLKDNTVCLVIHNNSSNIPEKIDIENSKGFGLTLVRMLIKQLGGEISIDNDNGLKVTLNFRC